MSSESPPAWFQPILTQLQQMHQHQQALEAAIAQLRPAVPIPPIPVYPEAVNPDSILALSQDVRLPDKFRSFARLLVLALPHALADDDTAALQAGYTTLLSLLTSQSDEDGARRRSTSRGRFVQQDGRQLYVSQKGRFFDVSLPPPYPCRKCQQLHWNWIPCPQAAPRQYPYQLSRGRVLPGQLSSLNPVRRDPASHVRFSPIVTVISPRFPRSASDVPRPSHLSPVRPPHQPRVHLKSQMRPLILPLTAPQPRPAGPHLFHAPLCFCSSPSQRLPVGPRPFPCLVSPIPCSHHTVFLRTGPGHLSAVVSGELPHLRPPQVRLQPHLRSPTATPSAACPQLLKASETTSGQPETPSYPLICGLRVASLTTYRPILQCHLDTQPPLLSCLRP